MNRYVFLAAMFVLIVFYLPHFMQASTVNDGKTLFRDNCKACHTIGKGTMVGPDLKDIDKKRSESWLLKWIKSSKSLIDAKDPEAVALFEEYNKVPMPEFPAISDANVKTILDYIKSESNPVVSVASNTELSQTEPSKTIQKFEWFSAPYNLLLGLIVLLLVIIYYLSGIIKRLAGQLANAYIDDRNFF